MRALITGASGFIGSHLVTHLRKKGWEIETLGRSDTPDSVERKMREFQPQVVFHLATFFVGEHKSSDIPALIQSNLQFSTQIVDCMVRNGVKTLVNTGTLWQYYQGHRDEPATLYAATKSAFESILKFYVSAHGLKVMNLMLSDSFGPGDTRPKLLPKLLSLAGTKEEILLSPGEQILEWTFVSDLVRAFEIAGERLVSGKETQTFTHYTVTSGEALSLKDSVRVCEEVVGEKIPVKFGARPYRAREVMKPEKLDPALPGWTAEVSFREGVKACSDE